jgi:hypothetical protein
MPWIGHRAEWLLASRWFWAVLGAIAAIGPALWMWGFTVDDALIAVRYARNIANGVGWRFNTQGPSTDGVTPLLWPLVLTPVARAPALVVLWRASALGLVAWAVAGTALGAAIGQVRGAPRWARVAAIGTMALSVPLAAHAVSGMETALATALATCAALSAKRPCLAALIAGLAASLRPEMAVWAWVLAMGVSIAARVTIGRLMIAVALAVAPFAFCAAVRTTVWGHPAPLALMAKPSDIDHGLVYAGAACLVTLVPILVIAPFALRRAVVALAIVAAAVAHVAAIIAVGGDWMPYARLMVPVTPSLVYAAVVASEHAHAVPTIVRSIVAIALGAVLIARGGTDGRRVSADRAALIRDARPRLVGTRTIAALDIGWVSAASDANIVDLAGLTDPEIAALPGGHTSKRVDAMFLLSLRPDALLLYAPQGLPDGQLDRWDEATYPRVVEARLARDPVTARHFTPTAWLPLGRQGAGYVLLTRREAN